MLLILLGTHVPVEVIKWKSFENIFKCVAFLATNNKMYFITGLISGIPFHFKVDI